MVAPPDVQMPKAALHTLETILAPGRRSRLSPFVESAQFAVLFGETPDERRRAESARQIIARHHRRVRAITGHWNQFAASGKDFSSNDYTERDFLDAYLANYFSVNVAKVQWILLDLVRNGRLSGSVSLLDVGVGTGTTAIAMLDFLLVWGYVCDLYEHPFPVTNVRLVGLDRSKGSLDHARRVVEAYAQALARRLASRAGRPAGPTVDGGSRGVEPSIIEQVHDWAEGARWEVGDLEQITTVSGCRPSLLVAANVLNELGAQGRSNLESMIAQLDDGAIVAIIEPGQKETAEALMRWRRRIVREHGTLVPLGPCGEEFGTDLPSSCDACWNLRRESFHPSTLYGAFREAAAGGTGNDQRVTAYENLLLSWSYAILARERANDGVNSVDTVSLRGESRLDTVRLRYIGSYRNREPVNYDPDEFRAESSPANWNEYLKVCPASLGASGAVLERRPGFQTPPLRFGQTFVARNVDAIPTKGQNYRLLPVAGDQTGIAADLDQITPMSFLPTYTDTVRLAIDEVAYRLFGFTAMQDFQHRILSRVLTGRSILGIAATGSGKSECFILPAILLPGITVVVSPLKSLMSDQYHQRIHATYGLDHLTTYLNGDVPFHERQARLRRMELGYYKLVYVTPEQLERGWVLDSLRRANEAVGVRYLAMDEAHCISQWGHDFRPAYLNISRRLGEHGIEPVRIALTATASPNVRADICDELHLDPAPLDDGGDVYVESSNRPELNLVVRVKRTTAEKVDDILDQLQGLQRENERNSAPGAAIVFMPWTGGSPDDPHRTEGGPLTGRQSAGVTPFAAYLERSLNTRVAIYHGQMEADEPASESERPEASAGNLPLPVAAPSPGVMEDRTRQGEQNVFIHDQRRIMVATKGFGMGIDKPNIRLVIHRSPTANLEAYAQEAGRAGRDRQPATVILYYSPDAPTEDSRSGTSQSTIPSDHEIQQFFLSDRYVRREDVMVMCAFLRTVMRNVAGHLYFTNDEGLEFFERCAVDGSLAGLVDPYTWPDFPPRRRFGFETPDHEAILDRGHAYNSKTGYLNRIVQVLNRIRPEVRGQKRLALLEQVHETGAQLVNPRVLRPEAILEANAYFGRCFREAGVTRTELEELFVAGDLLALARRLRLSVREASSLVGDIRHAERPSSALLDVRAVVAPRFGPAADHVGLQAWRDYAGAARRAPKPEADRRARRAGRPVTRRKRDGNEEIRQQTTLDDWFGWRELARSRGWEVQLGDAFFDTDHFSEYLDAFMALHDAREANDWAAYNRLLTDYIGIQDDGGISGWRYPPNCLRAVLLGYLKTFEVVAGGNCLSCNHCVPDEHFVASAEERQAVVVRLGARIEGLLEQADSYATALPPGTLVDAIVAAVRDEEAQGRSLSGYLAGWSARLLQDTPDHRAAMWIRLQAMAMGVLPVHAPDVVELGKRLAELMPDDQIGGLLVLTRAIRDTHSVDRELSDLHVALATRVRAFDEVEDVWHGVLRVAMSSADVALLVRVYTELRNLYDPNRGPLRHRVERYTDAVLHLARMSDGVVQAEERYKSLVGAWTWSEVHAEVMASVVERHSRVGPVIGLVCAWIDSGDVATAMARREQAIAHLEGDLTGWLSRTTGEEIDLILSRFTVDVLASRAELAEVLVESLVRHGANDQQSLLKAVALCVAVFKQGHVPLEHLADVLTSVLVREGEVRPSATSILAPLLGERELMLMVMEHAIGHFKPRSVAALETWFGVFPPDLLHDLSSAGRAIVVAATDALKERSNADSIPAPLLDSLERVVKGLLGDLLHGPDVHADWLTLCSAHPDRLAAHVESCLDAHPQSRDTWAEQTFSLMLEGAARESIRPTLERLRERKPKSLPPRLRLFVEFSQQMEVFEKWRGERDARPTADDFRLLRMVMEPQLDRDAADMLVAAIRFLRNRCPPTWLTPIRAEVEALCFAHRFAEAEILATAYPDVTIGAIQQPARLFVREWRARIDARDTPTWDLQYRQVLECCYPSQ